MVDQTQIYSCRIKQDWTLSEIADEQEEFRQGREQESKSRISEYRCTRHASTSNRSIYVLCGLQEGVVVVAMREVV